jgi:hypothetical protein
MSEQETKYPELPPEFTGQVLLKLTQPQFEELETLYGDEQLMDREVQYIQSLR